MATKVTSLGFDHDVSYFYLARAAEALGYPEPAKHYYEVATEKSKNPETACKGRFLDICDGSCGTPLEYAVRMRQFSPDDELAALLATGSATEADLGGLGTTIARFHAALPPRRDGDPAYEVDRATRPSRNNFTHLDPAAFDDEGQQRLAVIEAWTLQQAEAMAPEFARRAREGAVRECHGDLHLENLLLQDGCFVPFESAIEFNPDLRWIDIANDIAFLVMDLMAHGWTGFAYTVLSAWLEATGAYDSVAVMRFYLANRSMVRAVVTAIRQRQTAAPAEGVPESDPQRSA